MKTNLHGKIFLLANLIEMSSQSIPIIIRVDNRQWNIPLDVQVGQEITKVYLRTSDPNPIVHLDKVASNWGPFHDASAFFELIRQNVSNGEVNYDVIVKKP